MKNLSKKIVIFTALTLSTAYADKNRIAEINSLNVNKQYEESWQLANRYIRQIRSEMKVGKLVEQSNFSFTRFLQEKVTQQIRETNNTEDTRVVGSQSGCIGAFTLTQGETTLSAESGPCFIYGGNTVSSWDNSNKIFDVSAILVKNPEEVANFSWQAQNDYLNLKAKLEEHLDKNKQKILELKIIGILGLQAATNLALTNKSFIHEDDLSRMIPLLLDINFLGEQKIITCVQNEYAEKTESYSRDNGENQVPIATGMIGSLMEYYGVRQSSPSSVKIIKSTSKKQFAYVDKSCEVEIKQAQSTADFNSILAYDLAEKDREVLSWIRVAYSAWAFNGKAGKDFPRFGNPYYKN